MADPSTIRVIREALETVLMPEEATRVLFAALDTLPELPDTRSDTLNFVEGPLRMMAETRLGSEAADALVEQIKKILVPEEPVTARHPTLADARMLNFDAASTARIPITDEPVRIVVVAQGKRLAETIAFTLGPENVLALTADSLVSFGKAIGHGRPPALILIDAADFPAIEPAEVIAVLLELQPTVVRAIWGVELPYGTSLLRVVGEDRRGIICLERKEGLDPLFDILRSRKTKSD